MTKRQLSADEEGELNTPEFDDDIDDRPPNILPMTMAPIRMQPLPFSSTTTVCPFRPETKRPDIPRSDPSEMKDANSHTPIAATETESRTESPHEQIHAEEEGEEQQDQVEPGEDISDSELYELLEGKVEGASEAGPSSGPPAKRRQFAIVGDKLISGPDFNVTKYIMDEFPDSSVLPTDWVKINHESGIPIYFHKRTRVATVSKPFCVGKYQVRLRHIPLSSVPCLKQKRDLTAVQLAAEKNEAVAFDHRNLQHAEVREYCSKLFKIKQLSIGRWTNWRNRRQYEKLLNRVNKEPENPELSNVKIIGGTTSTKVIVSNGEDGTRESPSNDVECDKEQELETENTEKVVKDESGPAEFDKQESGLISRGTATYIRIPQVASKVGEAKSGTTSSGGNAPVKGRKQYLRVDGKPANAVLNEFTVLSTGDYPQYDDVQLPSCERSGEFCCVVKISGIIYGIGRGRNKKIAKLEAAQEALRALIPGWRQSGLPGKPGATENTGTEESTERDPMLRSVSVFDSVPVDNPNITEMLQQLGLPTPYKILQTCLLRNFGIGDTELNCTVEQLSAEEANRSGQNKGGQHHQFRLDKVVRLSVGERSAEVRAVSAKQGKHLAAQALLKQMHPHINNWASILRLYLRGPDVNLTATTALQRDTAVHEMAVQKRSSSEILTKLREEMRKLASQLEQKKETEKSGTEQQSSIDLVTVAKTANVSS